ncbi:MAG: XdhC family protein [Ferruginibacter sp.]|nr:XdhC family protein [Ferruginibacter sp.]
MKEIKAIIKACDMIEKTNTHAALATVVRVEGSSYRSTGARMLVMDNGRWVGGISGGCLEGDALKRARIAMAKSISTLITYDTTEGDAYQIGVGLGCNGVIDVLFTPLNFSDKNNPVEILKSCVAASRQTHVLITITRLEGNWMNLMTGQTIKYTSPESLGFFGNDWLAEQCINTVNRQLAENKSAPQNFLLEDGRKIETFIEILPPEINLVIMGYQYDVYPLSRLVKEIGWRVTIVASPQKLNATIIAIADEVIEPESFTNLPVDEHTVIILMSHDYKTDKYNLPKALATAAPYIGMLGPRVRSEKIWRELEEEGIPISAENLNRIHAPIGLDIGAVTPEEIALSLAAEVRASLSKRNGGFLRLRTASIHER